MTPELRPVRDVLDALRARLRAVRLLRAVALLVAAVAVAVLFSFALDRFLDLPWMVRVVHLVVVSATLCAVFAWATRPLRARVADADLAQALEDVVPELRDRVASALDFERRLQDPEERESREMMRVVIRQAAAFAQRVTPGSLVDGRPARRAAGVAAVAAIAFVATAAAAPDDFALWVKRGLLLQDVEWPRRTHIRVLDFPEDRPRIVTHGDDLQVVAEVEGTRPRELELHYEALEIGDDGQAIVTERDTRRMFPIEDENGATGRYSFQFRSIATSFRFWVTGGDDDDEKPVHEVRALIPPRVASITGRVTYPAYSSLSPATVREASFDVLEGSEVHLELRTNMPVAAARMLHEGGAVEELTLGTERDLLTIDLQPHADVVFHLELVAETGQTNGPDDDRFLIRAVADRVPSVRVLFPVGRLYRTPNGVVPVKAVVRDDFGIVSADLRVEADEAVVRTVPLFPPPATEAPETEPAAAKRADIYHPLELQTLAQGDAPAALPGEVLRLLVGATDNDRQEFTAPEVTIEVLAPEELERRLAQRQVGLRDQLTQLRAHQRRTLEGIRALRTALADRASGDPSERDRGRDLQVEQGRVTNEIEQFLRGIHRVLDAYVLNRLGSVPTIDRVLPLYHEALAQPVEDGDEVFPRSLYETIVTEKRERRLYDPEILGTLLDIMDIGDLARFELSPGVYEALRSWADAADARPELVEEAQRRAEELEEKLRELDRRMDRWEDLNEIIELARQITIRQRELAAPLESGGESR